MRLFMLHYQQLFANFDRITYVYKKLFYNSKINVELLFK